MIYRVYPLCRTITWLTPCSDYGDDTLWSARLHHHLTRLLSHPVDREQCPYPDVDEEIARCESTCCLPLYARRMIDPWLRRSRTRSTYCGYSHAGDGEGVRFLYNSLTSLISLRSNFTQLYSPVCTVFCFQAYFALSNIIVSASAVLISTFCNFPHSLFETMS